MTKQAWLEHRRNTEPHDPTVCPECKARMSTRRATARAKAIRHVYADLGMVRVRGNLGGTYYE